MLGIETALESVITEAADRYVVTRHILPHGPCWYIHLGDLTPYLCSVTFSRGTGTVSAWCAVQRVAVHINNPELVNIISNHIKQWLS